jgi:hypothetical protein
VVSEGEKTLAGVVAWAEKGEVSVEFAAVGLVEGLVTKFRRSKPQAQFLSREPLPQDQT